MKLKHLFLSLFAAISCFAISGCGKKETGEDPMIDYARDGSVSLQLDYQGKSFWRDGIEKVELKTAIDGDTVHFKTSTGDILKARFYGIDTPESTGQVQPWGKEASNFTKEKVDNANKNGTIVISSPRYDYGAPEPDTTGERYVSLVWLSDNKKNAAYNELYLLNLLIVQEGLSWVKSVAAFPEYAPTFDKASSQAEARKLGVFSDKPAPLFNYGGYEDASLIDIKREIVASYKDPSHQNKYANANVRVQGTVVGSANHVLYIQDYFTQEDRDDVPAEGEYAGLNIFTGMGSIPSKFYTPGNYIQVCGVCTDSETFGFQLSGCTFATVSYSENDAKVIYYADNAPAEKQLKVFEKTAAEINTMISNKDYNLINCAIKCTTTLTCNRAYKSESKSEFTLYFEESQLNAYVTFSYQPVEGEIYSTVEQFVGKKFKVSGVYVPHKQNSGNIVFQINPTNDSYLELVA